MYKAVCSPRIRDEIGHDPPTRRNHFLRPRDTGDKEEDKRCGDQQDEACFAITDKETDTHRHEDDRQDERHIEHQNIHDIAYMRQVKQSRQEAQEDSR